MHLSEGGGGLLGGNVLMRQGMWRVVPETGQVALSEQALAAIVKTDPIEKWYILDTEPIARGQFATVYHCRHRITGEQFAVKFASRRRLGADATPDIIHEIAVNAILASCVRNVKLHDVFTTDAAFVLIMEYAPGGDLQTLLDENLVPYEHDVISFLRQLLEGLVFIHDRSLVHLDIKPQNLVLMGDFPDCDVKLCDFEISRLLTPGYEVREILGTPDYVAPEILHYEPITTRTDMWSMGVLTYVLLTGFLPFGGDSDQETFMQISRGELDFPNELFEDITPEAIDFMKKLLIRQPEKRMSARECLNHPWMKKPMARPSAPSTLNLPSPIIPPQHTHTPPVCRAESSPSVITPTRSEPEPVPTSKVADSSAPQTDVIATPQVTGRPPLHPRTSQKSMSVTGDLTPTTATPTSGAATPLSATTPFLNKESRMGSRQNLNRLRSISKSREVLSERIQMSNLKKTLSKSRERLYDARLGSSTSRDDLFNCKSLSQSVEALTALSQLHQNGALYKSCNNIFIPMIHLVKKEDNRPDRMYQSLASIDQIPGNDLSRKMGYFESRFTSDDDYTDILTRHNTNLNMVISDTADSPTRLQSVEESRLGGLRGNPCRGGRGAEGCDRHTLRQPEAQSTQKINKMSRADRMKKDAQRRRKERKEREITEKERNRKASLNESRLADRTPIDGSSSPTTRRGSVCHVEQRLQERHERLLERQEREGRKLGVTGSRRLSSIDSDRSPVSERTKSTSNKSNSLTVSADRPRSITPTRRLQSKVDSPQGSDVSQASSMENVSGSLENVQTRQPANRRKSKQSSAPKVAASVRAENESEKTNDVNDNVVTSSTGSSRVPPITLKYTDEAYISLEKETKNIQSATIKSDDVESVESDNTCTGSVVESAATPTDSNKPMIITSIDESEITSTDKCEESTVTENEKESANKCTSLPGVSQQSTQCEELIKHKYFRSISTTSDLGITVSDESEENADQFAVDIEAKILDTKARSRSFSVQAKPCPIVLNKVRNRSNSVNQMTQDRARPWGDICSGSVAKALRNFTIQEDPDCIEPPTTEDNSTTEDTELRE